MFSRISITKSVKDYPAKIERLKDELKSADVIVVGAGAGLSTSGGIVHPGRMRYNSIEKNRNNSIRRRGNV